MILHDIPIESTLPYCDVPTWTPAKYQLHGKLRHGRIEDLWEERGKILALWNREDYKFVIHAHEYSHLKIDGQLEATAALRRRNAKSPFDISVGGFYIGEQHILEFR